MLIVRWFISALQTRACETNCRVRVEKIDLGEATEGEAEDEDTGEEEAMVGEEDTVEEGVEATDSEAATTVAEEASNVIGVLRQWRRVRRSRLR